MAITGITSFLLRGNLGDLPSDNSMDTAGRRYVATDVGLELEDDGASWNVIKDISSLPRVQSIFMDECQVVAGNALLVEVDATQRYGFVASQDPPADGDHFTFQLLMQAAYYDLSVLCRTTPDGGLLEWAFDGDGPYPAQDLYSASDTNEQDVLVAEHFFNYVAGVRTLHGRINGQNGSSSGYRAMITRVALKPS